jgi:hypothetical protein
MMFLKLTAKITNWNTGSGDRKKNGHSEHRINKASLKASETNYKRNKILMEKGVVSVQFYEFTEENFIRNTVNLQNAYDKERSAIVKLEDAKKR